ncbi:MAG: RbsD/FucU domain-containing protein [Pseudomonadota bacterium]
MLKNLDPLLHADLLHALRAMGHGDDLVLCDSNFPADGSARGTTLGTPLRLDGVGLARAVRTVLSVMPLDTFVDDSARRMEVVGEPGTVPPVISEAQHEIDQAEGKPWPIGALERFAFYERAKKAYCIIATGEPRFYGNLILKKGVIPPP